jgi:hypothetical protein
VCKYKLSVNLFFGILFIVSLIFSLCAEEEVKQHSARCRSVVDEECVVCPERELVRSGLQWFVQGDSNEIMLSVTDFHILRIAVSHSPGTRAVRLGCEGETIRALRSLSTIRKSVSAITKSQSNQLQSSQQNGRSGPRGTYKTNNDGVTNSVRILQYYT